MTEVRPMRPGTIVVAGGSVLALFAALAASRFMSVWVSTGVAALVILGLVAAIAWREARDELTKSPRLTTGAVAAGVASCALPYLVYPFASHWLPGLAREVTSLYAMIRIGPGALAAFPVVVAVVVAEELVFRGLVFGALGEQLTPTQTIAAAVGIYAIPQLGSGTYALPMLALGCGLVWTLQRAWTGSLWVSLATHLAFNLLALAAFPLEP